MSDNRNKQAGFSLVEIAIVLVIVGLLIGMGVALIGPLTKRVKDNEAKEIVDAAVESLMSYGASNNELPDTTAFPTVIRKPADVWGKNLYYVLEDNLKDSSAGGICGISSTNLTINICPDSGCGSPDIISNVAFIVLSSGGNFNNQTTGTLSVTSATTINIYDVGISIDNYTTDMDRTEANDDIAKWIAIDELRAKAGCTVTRLKIASNELPYGFEGTAYSAAIYGDGGVPYSSGGAYRWCRQESASTGLTFTPTISSSDCLGIVLEASWTKADSIVISGTPTTAGSYNFTFFVRDDKDSSGTDDNIAQKVIVLTINPPP